TDGGGAHAPDAVRHPLILAAVSARNLVRAARRLRGDFGRAGGAVELEVQVGLRNRKMRLEASLRLLCCVKFDVEPLRWVRNVHECAVRGQKELHLIELAAGRKAVK